MRNFVKWFGIIALAAVIGFSMAGCDLLFGNDYELLNGDWDRGDIVVTFNDSYATFTQINSDSAWKKVQNNGSISIGDRKFMNITKSSDRKWTCQERTYDTNTYIVKDWEDCTLTLSANGQTLTAYTPSTTNPTTTYTKK
jgi:hypothetical protein